MKQLQHRRRYKSGKTTVVNRGLRGSTQTKLVNPRAGDRQFKKHAIDMINSMQFPIITWPGYEKNYPEELRNRIVIDRMAQLMRDQKEFRLRATDSEALGYLSTASLINPLGADYTEIMSYLFNKVGKNLKIPMPKGLIPKTEISNYRMSRLNRLKEWIRKKQYQAIKNRRRK